jgi:hypothetical protein
VRSHTHTSLISDPGSIAANGWVEGPYER